jgi:hypothetical protein
MSKFSEIYNKLNDEQKKFVSEKKIEASYKTKHWLELLKNVALMDRLGDSSRGAKQVWAWVLMVVGVILFFIGFGFPPLLIVALIMIIVAIILFVQVSKLNQLDLRNNFREFVVPLLVLLKEETNDEEKISLKMEFKKPLDKSYLVQNIPNSNRGYPKVVTDIYKIPWMEGSAKMNDGTTIYWSFEDVICQKKVTKQNARGKIKVKTKNKVKHDIGLKMDVPKASYELKAVPADQIYTESADHHEFKIKGKTFSTEVQGSPDINYFLGLIAGVYNNLNQKK